MPFNLNRSFAALTPSIFLPLYKAFIRSHLEYAIQASSLIISVEFVKGLRHVLYETAIQRLRLFFLVCTRTRGDLICMHKIMHGLLDFPCDAVFTVPNRIGLRRHTFKIHQQRCKTPSPSTCVQRPSGPVLEQAARGYCGRYIHGDIQVATGCTVAVSLPRSSHLTLPPILLPEFVPPCRISSVCCCCNWSWSSIVVFTAR